VSFRPGACGRHTLYIVAGNGTRHEHTAQLRPIQVLCTDEAREGREGLQGGD
jgi:hypothetical protein